ncbi:hypothetical protein K4F52_009421 [Lecanicillium sp. MT-2017a]|nr:hypothetical protein K4F52_009421 [Lecanicillium sp. MT-2017a]
MPFPTPTNCGIGAVNVAASIMTNHARSPDRVDGLAYSAVVKGEFPSLSNNSQIGNTPSTSTWSQAGSRNVSAPVQRNQSTPLSSQHTGQDDVYNSNSSRAASTQASFRFGNQGNQNSSQATSSAVDDFPPLNRTVNGEERSASLMSSLGISTQGNAAPGLSGNRGNGLLNALSANNRSSETRPQATISGSVAPIRQGTEDEGRLRQAERLSKSLADGALQDADGRPPAEAVSGESKDEPQGTVDPLSGMSAADKWGIKGLRTLMHNYPDYHAMVLGMDPSSLGLDMSSQDLISTQMYSLFDETLPKPTVHASKFRLPDCYNVTNVQPIETKIQSFNEETLFWIFYSCPADVKQQMAAVEL